MVLTELPITVMIIISHNVIFHAQMKKSFITESDVCINTNVVPRPTAPLFGKLIAFDMLCFQKYANLLVAILLFHFILSCRIRYHTSVTFRAEHLNPREKRKLISQTSPSTA